MAVTMSPSIVDTRKFFILVYKILGVSIGVIQQMLSYCCVYSVSILIEQRKIRYK